MATPRVSHYNWERLRGVAQIDVGTDRVGVEDLSFNKWLDVAVPDDLEDSDPYLEKVDEFEMGEKDPAGYIHSDWKDGVEIEVDSGGRDRPHRPYIPGELVERLNQAVQREYPSVPVASYSFDDLLGLYLDRKLEYLEYLDCHVVGNIDKDGNDTGGQ